MLYISRNSDKNNRRIIIILLLVILALIAALLWLYFSHQQRIDKNAVGIVEGKQATTEYATIPGFESMIFAADTTEQEVYFANPESNTVNLQLTLSLPDGTELYKSDLIEPGKVVKNITISKALSPGTYENANLHYDCFTSENEKCNSANVSFKLIVEERTNEQ